MASVLTPLPSALAITVLNATHSEEALWTSEIHNTSEDELREQDLALSDSDMTDDSSAASPSASPIAKAAASPCSVDEVALDAASAWGTARPLRRKRARMSEEERKVRHREVQRQFMKRKRARIAVLRKVQSGVEKQLRLVRVLQEVETLKREQESLKQQYEACDQSSEEPAGRSSVPEPTSTQTFGDLVFSVPTEDESSDDDFEMTESDWSALYEMLSDDVNDCSDAHLPRASLEVEPLESASV